MHDRKIGAPDPGALSLTPEGLVEAGAVILHSTNPSRIGAVAFPRPDQGSRQGAAQTFPIG